MKTEIFNFELPEQQIAQQPHQHREHARLLVLSRQQHSWQHHRIGDLSALLNSDDVLVFNDSKVLPCRLSATTADSGSQLELLLLQQVKPDCWWVQCRRSRKQHIGRYYHLAGGISAKVIDVADEGQRLIQFSTPLDEQWLEEHGEMPLPPYIDRSNTTSVDRQHDRDRYQTVYARENGSAAAPTAGLHFSRELLDRLAAQGIAQVFVTLHVGLGTFLPIRSTEIENHHIHSEHYHLSSVQAEQLTHYKKEGRRIIAVGTTSLRLLESCWRGDRFHPGSGETSLYIYPGYNFNAIDELITNFHTPKSSLLVLVSALAGQKLISSAYQAAINNNYRFFSYGDAMWIRR